MFENFSDHSRIWIYGFERSLSAIDTKIVKRHIDHYMKEWHSHGDPVKGAYEILHDRFVIIVAESSVSGCSIDSTIKIFKRLKKDYHLDALNHDLVYYKDATGVSAVSRDEFQTIVDLGKISHETIVFNLTLTMLGVLRAGQWELPFHKSWHSLVFKKSALIDSNINAMENFNTRLTGT